MGGAWVIGHRAWNAQLGQRLMDAGVLMVAIDYRNFPRCGVPDMIQDLDAGLAWVFQNVASYGGDPANVVLTGQSAGAHLTAMLLLQRSMQEAGVRHEAEAASGGGAAARGEVELAGKDAEAGLTAEEEHRACTGGSPAAAWSPRELKGYVGVSGPYNLVALAQRLEARWIGTWALHCICPGGDLEGMSPTMLLQGESWRAAGPSAASQLPPMLLFHGEKDKTVPADISVEFAEALQRAGVSEAKADVRPGLAHADVMIEGPMRGEDYQIQLLLPFLCRGGADECEEWLRTLPPLRRMFPKVVINLASRFMPF